MNRESLGLDLVITLIIIYVYGGRYLYALYHNKHSTRGFLILLIWGGTFVHSVQMLIPSKQSVYFYYFG